MRKKDFDERQQFERGKAFQWAFLTAIVLLLVYFFVDEVLELCTFSTYFIFMTTFWISFAVLATKAILNDAFDGIKTNASSIFCIIYGILGLLILVLTVIEMFGSQISLIDNGLLNDDISRIINGISMLEVFTVYIIKRRKDKNNTLEEE